MSTSTVIRSAPTLGLIATFCPSTENKVNMEHMVLFLLRNTTSVISEFQKVDGQCQITPLRGMLYQFDWVL